MDDFIGVQAHLGGPVYDGRARKAIRDYTEAIQDEVALQYGVAVVDELKRVVKNPTPYYWTQIQVDRRGDDRVIHDSGVVYGPWLAGVSRRNATTRFKGYQHWRKATQRLRSRTPGIAVQLWNKYKPRTQ